MPTVQETREGIAQNDALYAMHFSGHSRLTRDLALLDGMLASARQLLQDAREAKGEARKELLATVQKQIELYGSERTAIAEAKRAVGPAGVAVAQVIERSSYAAHRYTRHFANQERGSRDAGMLLDVITELQAMKDEVDVHRQTLSEDGFADDVEVLERRIDLFLKERRAIAEARTEDTRDAQSGVLARAANTMFALYREGFAGQKRVSRRPELLARMIESLEDIRDRMEALVAQGFHDDQHDRNHEIVLGRIEAWQTEVDAIREARRAAALPDLVDELWTAAQAELATYGEHFAGMTRKTRDLDKLRGICDRLDEIERQLTALAQVQAWTELDRHLSTTRDALSLYQREYDEIVKAQAS